MSKAIPKIDEHNHIVGVTTIAEAVKEGWPRRIVRVFVFDGHGSMLLQQRSQNTVSYTGLWDQAAAGHVDVDETDYEAATRELGEELGLIDHKLIEVVAGVKNMDCFDTLYSLKIDKNTPITIDEHEVAAIRWFSIEEFEVALKADTDLFVPPFVNVWKKFKTDLIQ